MTNAIVTGAGVVGNVGSCKTEIAKIETEFGMFKQQVVHIQTNSCTGVVKEYHTWEPGPVMILGMVFCTVFCLIVTVTAIVRYIERR